MLDQRIDLTANRDFSQPQQRVIAIGAVIDNEFVTCDEYDAIAKHESIFGRRHRNEKGKIFGKTDEDFMEEMRAQCQKCGKPFRLPWQKQFGLCDECDREVDYEFREFPWQVHQPVIRRLGDVGQGDLFDLR